MRAFAAVEAYQEVACVLSGTATGLDAREYGTYTSVQEAIDASHPGDTITLVRNVTESVYLYNQTPSVTNLTLDLDGHTLSSSGESPQGLALFAPVTLFVGTSAEYGTACAHTNIVIKNGTLANNVPGSDYYGLTSVDGFEGLNLTVDGVTLTATNPANSYGMYLLASGTYTVHNSNVRGDSVGIFLGAGELALSGSTVTGGTSAAPGGIMATAGAGSALALIQQDRDLPVATTITNSALNAANAVFEQPASYLPAAAANTTLTVKSGIFAGDLATTTLEGSLAGGVYDHEPAANLLVDGATVNPVAEGWFAVATSDATPDDDANNGGDNNDGNGAPEDDNNQDPSAPEGDTGTEGDNAPEGEATPEDGTNNGTPEDDANGDADTDDELETETPGDNADKDSELEAETPSDTSDTTNSTTSETVEVTTTDTTSNVTPAAVQTEATLPQTSDALAATSALAALAASGTLLTLGALAFTRKN
jgi:hypothetical protein